jgi:TolB-like protein
MSICLRDTPVSSRILLPHIRLYLFLTVLALFPVNVRALSWESDRSIQDPAAVQDVLRIGVLELEANNVTASDARAIADRLRLYLQRQEIFEVLERNTMESIMNEVGFQYSGACNSNECVVAAGEVLGVSKMVAGSVSQVGSMFSLQVRIVDVQTSRIDMQSFSDVSGIEEVLRTATRDVAEELALGVKDQLGISEVVPQPEEQPEPERPPVREPGERYGRIVVPGPRGAGVWVDGDSLGVAPSVLQLPVGFHNISVEKEYYRPFRTSVNIAEGDSIRLNVDKLEELPWTVLTVRSNVEGAVVSVNGVPKARTPNAIMRLVEGSHRLELSREGYDSQFKDITVRRNIPEVWEVNLRRTGRAQLNLVCDLQGAAVYVDGNPTSAVVPIGNLGLEPGRRFIEVKAPGYSVWSYTVEVEDGSQETLRVNLTPKSRFAAGFLFMLLAALGSTGYGVTRYLDYQKTRDEYDDLQQQYVDADTYSEMTFIGNQIDDTYEELEDKYEKLGKAADILTGVWALSFFDAFVLMQRLPRVSDLVQSAAITPGVRGGRLTIALRISF